MGLTCAEFLDTYEVLALAILAGADPVRVHPALWEHALACPCCGLALSLLVDLIGRDDGR